MVAHPLHDVGMRLGDVVFLARVGLQVVELRPLDEPPTVPHDRTIPLGRPLSVLDDEHPVGQRIGRAAQQPRQAGPVERRSRGRVELAEIDQGRQQVLDLGQGRDVRGLPQPAGRPADEAGGAVTSLVVLRLPPAHAGVVHLRSGRGAVVVQVDHDRVLVQAIRAEELIEPPDVLVEVGHHPQERGRAFPHIGRLVFARHPVRPVRGVGRQVQEERLALALGVPFLIQSMARSNQTSVQ